MGRTDDKKFTKEELSKIRHDMKTPLTAALGYAELLNTKLNSEQEKEKRWVNEIINSLQKLHKMIDEKVR